MSDLAHAIHRPSVEDDAVFQHSNDLTPIAAYMELSSTTTFSPGTSNDLLTEIAGKESGAVRSASSSMRWVSLPDGYRLCGLNEESTKVV